MMLCDTNQMLVYVILYIAFRFLYEIKIKIVLMCVQLDIVCDTYKEYNLLSPRLIIL